MADGAPNGAQGEMAKAMEQLQAELEARGPFDELLEVRQYQMTLLRLSGDSWALVMDTPGRRRYAFPMTAQAKDGLNEILTRSKLDVQPGEAPPNMRGPAR